MTFARKKAWKWCTLFCFFFGSCGKNIVEVRASKQWFIQWRLLHSLSHIAQCKVMDSILLRLTWYLWYQTKPYHFTLYYIGWVALSCSLVSKLSNSIYCARGRIRREEIRLLVDWSRAWSYESRSPLFLAVRETHFSKIGWIATERLHTSWERP